MALARARVGTDRWPAAARQPAASGVLGYHARMTRRIHHFGVCSLDIAARELLRAGERVGVSPVVFDCIAYLIERRDRAVGRDELVAAVWGRTGVSDSVLGKTLLKVRRAVGDRGDAQSIVRTVPRFGFHWVAEVRVEEYAAPAGRPEDATAVHGTHLGGGELPVVPARRRVTTTAALGLALGAVIAVFAAWRWHGAGVEVDSSGPTAVAPPVTPETMARIAVLPVVVAAESAESWLRFGLMDLVAHHLRDGGAAVVPSESVVRLIDADSTIDQAALRTATGARVLIDSALRRVDEAWLLRVTMADAGGKRHQVQARGDDPIAVARDAAEQLLVLLGRSSRITPADVVDLPLTELSQRIEAAALAGDVATAGRLLEAASPVQRAWPELRLRDAQIDYQAGRTEAAYRKLTALRGEISAQTQPVLRARVLSKLGSTARVLGDFAAARSAFDEAIALLGDRHEPVTLGQAYVGRSISFIEQGQFAAASDDFSLARTVFQSIDDQFELSVAEYCEGLMENRRNRPLSSLPIFARVADRFEQFGALNELANVRSNQILTQYNLLQHGDAIATSDRSVSLLARLQNPIPRHQLQYARAMALAAVGRLAEARAAYATLGADVDPMHEMRLAAMIRLRQADLELQAGDARAALAIAQQVSEMPARADTALIRASGWLTVVQSLTKLERAAEAREQARQLVAWAASTNNAIAGLYGRLAEAEAAEASGRRSAALDLYADAMLQVEREGVPADVALVAVTYGRTLIAAGDLALAGIVAGRVTRYAEQDFASALLLVELYHAMGRREAWRAALTHVRTLAGERAIPPGLMLPPRPAVPVGPAPRSVAP